MVESGKCRSAYARFPGNFTDIAIVIKGDSAKINNQLDVLHEINPFRSDYCTHSFYSWR